MNPDQPLHATTLAQYGPGGWRGVLIQGPSGIGKSDLALRLMQQGWSLVADDWTKLWTSGGNLYASAPPRISGLMEVRGVGIVTLGSGYKTRAVTQVCLAVSATHDAVERLPQTPPWQWQGVAIPHLRLDPRPASASLVLCAAFAAL